MLKFYDTIGLARRLLDLAAQNSAARTLSQAELLKIAEQFELKSKPQDDKQRSAESEQKR